MASHTRRRDARGHLDPYFQRRTRYAAVLKPLGLDELFAQMPLGIQNQFCQYKIPDPVLEFDSTIAVNGKDRGLAKAMTEAFRRATVEINDTAIPVREFFSVFVGCLLLMQNVAREGMPPAVVRFVETARPLLEAYYAQALPEASEAMYYAVVKPLMAQSRLDVRLLASQHEVRLHGPHKSVVWVTVSAVEPQVRSIRLDGTTRPMYRAAQIGGEGVKWLSWTGEQLGRGSSQAQYPIYVQSHALRHLHSRVNLQPVGPYLEAWLGESLAKPCIVERQGNDLLVEYRIHKHRIGYLIVTPVAEPEGPGGVVAVRTFKFLTMEHTPEARLLEKKLRLTRRDVDWLGLHDLAAFTQTDLIVDPVLRPLLEACGCGHLFDMEEYDCVPQPKAFAGEMRRYLRMAA
jgi:hypothetical protein